MEKREVPVVHQTCRRCHRPDAPHKLLLCGRPRVPCVECGRLVARLQRQLAPPVPREPTPPPRCRAEPPALQAAVMLDCDPPISGVVERLDLGRELAYVRTRYGLHGYGFREIERVVTGERQAA